jgi:hypothetical protein
MGIPVDRAQAEQHLELAKRHVAEGRQRVAKQQELVVRLEQDGHDTRNANALLSQFEETLTLQEENLDRIKQEIGEGE